MDFEIQIPPDERFFVVRPMTNVSRDVIAQIVRQSIVYGGSCGRTHVLIDLCAQEFEVTLANAFQFAMDDAQQLKLYVLDRVALHAESFEKPLALLESMMQRAGYDWRFFSDIATAKAWLRGKYRPADARFRL